MRRTPFAEGEYYHVYAHSVGDLRIFSPKRNGDRFLATLFAANSEEEIPRLDQGPPLTIVEQIKNGEIELGAPFVEIVCFCIMPTHFHLLLKEIGENNVSRYLHKVLVSFSKYYNKKYERRGHVFEGAFNAKHLDSNEYILRASGYIHKNPKDLKNWSGKEDQYPWSSYPDYLGNARFGGLLSKNIILSQFDSNMETYREFVNSWEDDLDFA